jgi:hypothetical protein
VAVRITADHLRFWREKKAGTPKWYPPPKPAPWPVTPLIHTLINQQDTSRAALKGLEMSNMLGRMRAQRYLAGSLREWLAGIATQGSTRKQRALAFKWLQRMDKEAACRASK